MNVPASIQTSSVQPAESAAGGIGEGGASVGLAGAWVAGRLVGGGASGRDWVAVSIGDGCPTIVVGVASVLPWNLLVSWQLMATSAKIKLVASSVKMVLVFTVHWLC
jgi:hypothetical protein